MYSKVTKLDSYTLCRQFAHNGTPQTGFRCQAITNAELELILDAISSAFGYSLRACANLREKLLKVRST